MEVFEADTLKVVSIHLPVLIERAVDFAVFVLARAFTPAQRSLEVEIARSWKTYGIMSQCK